MLKEASGQGQFCTYKRYFHGACGYGKDDGWLQSVVIQSPQEGSRVPATTAATPEPPETMPITPTPEMTRPAEKKAAEEIGVFAVPKRRDGWRPFDFDDTYY